jgi:ABC-type dipeptide/oligopeptide/nickel transport system ATPase component
MAGARSSTLQVRNLSVAFQTDEEVIFANREITFDHDAGTWLSLMGHSGSGKTVLGRAIAGLLTGSPGIVQGTIAYRGANLLDALPRFVSEHRHNGTISFRKDVRRWQKAHWRNITQFARGHFAYIFQNPYDALNPYVPIRRHLEEAFLAGGTHPEELERSCIDLLVQLRLTPPARVLSCYPHELSGGMAQRVVVAMAMAQRASYIIADECTSSLDSTSVRVTLDLLHRLQTEEGCSVLFITHDEGLAQSFSHHMLRMERGALMSLNSYGQHGSGTSGSHP